MTQEILNRLLIDRSLDALAPDVSALLDAYLEREQDHSEAAQEIEESVRLARLALGPGPALQLPPLKLLPLPERPAAESRPHRAWWPAELAAALVLGIGLGFLAFRPGEPARVKVETAAATAPIETVDSGSSNAFWSVKRLARMEPKTASARAPRLTWKSFLQNPQANN
jgi:ferric-dicitrate binding protein FerR (iron transport regulator)